MNRVNPTRLQKLRLLEANAFRCCVCKRSSIGFNFHHIDGDSSNTADQNLALLCVEDHDEYHRPQEYKEGVKHLELMARNISRSKTSWEAFVAEARRPVPSVLATLSCYGDEQEIHSLQLALQWPDERIEYKRSFHLLDGDLDRLTDEVFKELAFIGPHMKMALINQPLPVEHCPCCGAGFSRTMKPAVVTRLTDPRWATDSLCRVHINPTESSLALVFSLGERELFGGSLHLCQGIYLHYSSEGVDDCVPLKPEPNVRAQATQIVKHILREWSPAKILIATGNPNCPKIISDLKLPHVWEKRNANKSKQRGPRRRQTPKIKR
jgi:hypothetical protein